MSQAEDRVSDLEAGFNPLARDLDFAFVLARLGGPHFLLLRYAREASWTSSILDRSRKPKPFVLNLTEIAKDSRIGRQWLSRQQAELVAWKIFSRREDGSYLINKDYTSWIDDDGNPRLADRQIILCKKQRSKVRTVVDRRHPPGTIDDTTDRPPCNPHRGTRAGRVNSEF
jgi:hypothetical protein